MPREARGSVPSGWLATRRRAVREAAAVRHLARPESQPRALRRHTDRQARLLHLHRLAGLQPTSCVLLRPPALSLPSAPPPPCAPAHPCAPFKPTRSPVGLWRRRIGAGRLRNGAGRRATGPGLAARRILGRRRTTGSAGGANGAVPRGGDSFLSGSRATLHQLHQLTVASQWRLRREHASHEGSGAFEGTVHLIFFGVRQCDLRVCEVCITSRLSPPPVSFQLGF